MQGRWGEFRVHLRSELHTGTVLKIAEATTPRASQGVLTDLGVALCLPPGGLACRLAVILVIQAQPCPPQAPCF
jgi:hypothetical protein